MTTVALVILILCALTILIAARIASLMMTKPHFRINSEGDFYLDRWYVIPRNLWFNIYLHHTLRDDDPQALHDHPWWNVSLVLKGGYWEVMPGGKFMHMAASRTETHSAMAASLFQPPFKRKWRGPGSIVLRRATDAHRLELTDMDGPVDGWGDPIDDVEKKTSWSLFITGSKRRTWGFWMPEGWVPFDRVTRQVPGGSISFPKTRQN